MKGEIRVESERAMLASNLIDALNLPVEIAGRVPVARLDLILLRVQVLLAARAHGHVLEQLVSAVDAVARQQRRREQETHAKRRAAAVHEILVENVRRVREEIAAEV